MMARQTGPEFFGEFESEHNFSHQLYSNAARARILKQLGFKEHLGRVSRRRNPPCSRSAYLGPMADYASLIRPTG